MIDIEYEHENIFGDSLVVVFLHELTKKKFANFSIRKLMFGIMPNENFFFMSRSKKIDYLPESSFSSFCWILRIL